MYKNKENKILLKLFFNEFKYFSFIISLITIFLLLFFFVKRVNTVTITSEFLNSQFKFDKYSDTRNEKSSDMQKYIVLDLDSLIKSEKSEKVANLISSFSDLILNINKELNLNKLNLELKKKNISYDLDKKIITFTFIQSYSFFNYRQISDDNMILLSEIIQNEINKILIQKKLSMKSIVTLSKYKEDISIYYKIISSIFLLTFFFNFIYASIKYRKIFF
jgi:hypothetical protein